MKGHHGKNAAGLQHRLGGAKPVLDLVKLAVDVDAQRLKASCRRIDLARARCRHHRMDDRRQLAGGGDRRLGAGAHDGAGDAARGAFLAIIPQDLRQRALIKPHHGIGRAVAGFRHPHVEGAVQPEGKAAFSLVNLRRADAEIEGDAVKPRIRPGKVAHVGKAAFIQTQPVAIAGDEFAAAGDGVGVAVDGDDGAGGGVEDGLGVAAIAEGGVKIEAAINRGQG